MLTAGLSLLLGNVAFVHDIRRLIVGGAQASKEDWPFIVRLYRGPSDRVGVCGGTLIAPSTVLTAAHCIDACTDLRVGVAQQTIFSDDEVSDPCTEIINVVTCVTHPQWTGNAVEGFDATLLTLERAPTCGLQSASVDADNYWPSDGTGTPPIPLASVGGWGATEVGGAQQYWLRAVDVYLYTRWQCTDFFGGSLSTSNACAGTYPVDGFDACSGDSGGPLIVRNGTSPAVLVGIVSWGIGDPACGDGQYPGVYTHVASLRDFLASVPGISFATPAPLPPIDENVACACATQCVNDRCGCNAHVQGQPAFCYVESPLQCEYSVASTFAPGFEWRECQLNPPPLPPLPPVPLPNPSPPPPVPLHSPPPPPSVPPTPCVDLFDQYVRDCCIDSTNNNCDVIASSYHTQGCCSNTLR